MNTDNSTKPKVFVAMSGGVDSSVAAKLLSDKNYEVAGMFLHFWKETPPAPLYNEGEEFENKCCSAEAFADARRVCQKIGIPLYTLNFSQIFKKEIVDNFINEYKAGNTPNPCARCNKFVKLGLLIKRAEKLGFDYVASGHYARSKKTRKQKNKKAKFIYKLYRAKDKEKDQSYFLYNLAQEQLKRLIFPLGSFTKEETRKMARKFKLPVSEKKDSQEVCFIPGKSHNDFLKRYINMRSGDIKLLYPIPFVNSSSPCKRGSKNSTGVSFSRAAIFLDSRFRGNDGISRTGVKIGKHQGLPLYTIGQRRGIEIGGTGPYYAAKFDYKKNILYVVDEADDPALFSDKLIAKNVNWISGQPPKFPLKCEAVIRYRHKAVKCKISPLVKGGGGVKNDSLSVKFSEQQRAVTPGQSIVFYKGDEVFGGGVIDRAIKK